jgi:hypothetical protein
MVLLAITILGTFLGTVLAVEAKAWMPHLSACLVRATIARFPDGIDEDMRARWTEEIEADLAGYGDRPLGGILFGLRLRLKGGRELCAQLALQAALDAGSRASQAEQPAAEPSFAKAITGLDMDLGASAAILYQVLLGYLRKAAASDEETRALYLDEVRASMVRPVVRKAIDRIGPPDLSDLDGLRLAMLLSRLRKEVEEWSDRG